MSVVSGMVSRQVMPICGSLSFFCPTLAGGEEVLENDFRVCSPIMSKLETGPPNEIMDLPAPEMPMKVSSSIPAENGTSQIQMITRISVKQSKQIGLYRHGCKSATASANTTQTLLTQHTFSRILKTM